MVDLNYSELCIQEYMLDGNTNTEISKLIFKPPGRNLNIKEHKRWKYEDALCVGCKENSESENELLSCPGFSESNEKINEEISYSLVFGDKASKTIKVAKEASVANGPVCSDRQPHDLSSCSDIQYCIFDHVRI